MAEHMLFRLPSDYSTSDSLATRRKASSRWRTGLALILVIGFGVPMLYSRLGARSLAGDEAIYGVVVREALAGAWQPLRYGGEIFAYPPLKLWINAWVASAWELGEQ